MELLAMGKPQIFNTLTLLVYLDDFVIGGPGDVLLALLTKRGFNRFQFRIDNTFGSFIWEKHEIHTLRPG